LEKNILDAQKDRVTGSKRLLVEII
jgi:hypothetical protein